MSPGINYLMVTFIAGLQPEKIVQRVMKIHASSKSLVERLCDFKIYAISVRGFIGSVCAPSKPRIMPFSVPSAAK